MSWFLTGTNSLFAQVSDTAVYIRQIILDKNNYIGKPFSALAKDLKIKIRSFCGFAIPRDINKETRTFFGFIDPATDDDFPGLLIYWQYPLDAKRSDLLWEQAGIGHWTLDAADFYNNAIIRNISYLGELVDNNGDKLPTSIAY
jgi:hypothetical protein